jgi:hypothetical protein
MYRTAASILEPNAPVNARLARAPFETHTTPRRSLTLSLKPLIFGGIPAQVGG